MPKLEYTSHFCVEGQNDEMAILNQHGREGWQLCAATEILGAGITFYFGREIPEVGDSITPKLAGIKKILAGNAGERSKLIGIETILEQGEHLAAETAEAFSRQSIPS